MIMFAQRNFIAAIVTILLLMHISSPHVNAQACEWCERRAAMGEADAGSTGIELGSSLLSRLAEVLTTSCFHLLRTDIMVPASEKARFGSKYHPPEYVFTGKYEENLNEPQVNDRPIMSRLTISIHYNGDTREPVQTWVVNSTVNSYTSCTNRMFKNDNAVMRSVKPIERILWDFERAPTQCKLDLLHEATELGAGQEWKLDVSNFRDKKGRESKHFNRFVVKAEQGEILNGTACEDDPKAKAFKIGDGHPEVKYKAPDKKGLTQDTITIYNSCEICPENLRPMSKTPKKEKIAEKTIRINRGDYLVNIQCEKSWKYEDKNARYRYEGMFTTTMSGPLKKWKETPHQVSFFEPMGVVAQWSYREKTIDLKPPLGCPELLREYKGSGAYSINPGKDYGPIALAVHYFKGLGKVGTEAAKFGWVDHYDLMLSPLGETKLRVPGKHRYGSGSPKCQDYKEGSINVDPLAVTLRCKISNDEVFSGSESWTSHSGSNSLETSDLPEMFKERPHSPYIPGDRFKYSIRWKITKMVE